MFDRLIWQKDRMLLDDWVFRLEHCRSDSWELGDECFVFYKIKPLVDQYARYWSAHRLFRANQILELGIWDGGSMAFWFEFFQPKKHVGIDLASRGDRHYFERYVTSKGLTEHIKTYWGVDQADAARLRGILQCEFDGPLDIVIDDASHLYEPTKASFETLFPQLRPGGLYIIEDWAWAHWREFQSIRQGWATETALTQLVYELIEAAGSSIDPISNVTVFQGFAVIERGTIDPSHLDRFRLKDHIVRRPTAVKLLRLLHGVKQLMKCLPIGSRR
jgi:hypothetical protein